MCTFESYWIAREASRKEKKLEDDDDRRRWYFYSFERHFMTFRWSSQFDLLSELHKKCEKKVLVCTFLTTRVVWCRSHHGDTFHRHCVSSRARVSHRQTSCFYYAIEKVQKKTSGKETLCTARWMKFESSKQSFCCFSRTGLSAILFAQVATYRLINLDPPEVHSLLLAFMLQQCWDCL